jgi:hypothetical protein
MTGGRPFHQHTSRVSQHVFFYLRRAEEMSRAEERRREERKGEERREKEERGKESRGEVTAKYSSLLSTAHC